MLFIATAGSIAAILVGWCVARLAFNAVLASIVALLPDQVPPAQRGTVSGVLGICMSIGQVTGTFLVQAVADSMLQSFMLSATIGVVTVLLLALVLPDRRLPNTPGQLRSTGTARSDQYSCGRDRSDANRGVFVRTR